MKQDVVEEAGTKDIRLVRECVAEFWHGPARAKNDYRVVVLRKDVEIVRGQTEFVDNETTYLFYITNIREMTPAEVVGQSNKQCAQEKLIGELKSGVGSLKAPVDSINSNWAFMVMSSLAWSMKAWSALLLDEDGHWAKRHKEDKTRILTVGFRGFVEEMIRIPVQIVTGGRRVIVRLIGWNPVQQILLRLIDLLERPQLC